MRYVDASLRFLDDPDPSDKLLELVELGGEVVGKLTECGPERAEALARAEEERQRREDALGAPDAIADLSETVSDNAAEAAATGDAVADLSETVSDNAAGYAELADAVAELSQLVSDLISSKED